MVDLDQILTENEYDIDSELYAFLVESYTGDDSAIVSIIDNLHSLNSIYHNHNKFYIEKLEQRLLDIISIANNVDDAVSGIEGYIKKAITRYLRHYSIELEFEDLNIYKIEDIIRSWNTLFQVDIPTCEEYLRVLEDDMFDNIEKASYLLSQYSIYQEPEIFDIIKEVGDDFFKHLSMYYRAKIHRGVEDINSKDLERIKPLLESSQMFKDTYIVKDILYYGYTDFNFEDILDKLYTYLKAYHGNCTKIAYEIAATNALSKDQPIRDFSSLESTINLKAIDEVPYITAIEVMAPIAIELCNSIKG